MILQSHVKAKKYMAKLFLLYDDLAALCDVVIVTRVGTFRGSGYGSTDCDAEGSEQDEDRVVWPASEEEGQDFFDNPVSNPPSAFMGFWALI